MPLLSKINPKSANIGVIGLGYVGLPLVIEFGGQISNLSPTRHVTGFDVDEQKVALLCQGKSYIRHIDLREQQCTRYCLDIGSQAKVEATHQHMKADMTIFQRSSICCR